VGVIIARQNERLRVRAKSDGRRCSNAALRAGEVKTQCVGGSGMQCYGDGRPEHALTQPTRAIEVDTVSRFGRNAQVSKERPPTMSTFVPPTALKDPTAVTVNFGVSSLKFSCRITEFAAAARTNG
jgi:hypothetical protein